MDLVQFWKENASRGNPWPAGLFSGSTDLVPWTDSWVSVTHMTHRTAASAPTDHPGVVKYNDGTGLAFYDRSAAWAILGIATQEQFNTVFHEDLIVVIPRLHGSKRVREEITDACSLHDLAAARFPGITGERVFGAHLYCYSKYYQTIDTLPPT